LGDSPSAPSPHAQRLTVGNQISIRSGRTTIDIFALGMPVWLRTLLFIGISLIWFFIETRG